MNGSDCTSYRSAGGIRRPNRLTFAPSQCLGKEPNESRRQGGRGHGRRKRDRAGTGPRVRRPGTGGARRGGRSRRGRRVGRRGGDRRYVRARGCRRRSRPRRVDRAHGARRRPHRPLLLERRHRPWQGHRRARRGVGQDLAREHHVAHLGGPASRAAHGRPRRGLSLQHGVGRGSPDPDRLRHLHRHQARRGRARRVDLDHAPPRWHPRHRALSAGGPHGHGRSGRGRGRRHAGTGRGDAHRAACPQDGPSGEDRRRPGRGGGRRHAGTRRGGQVWIDAIAGLHRRHRRRFFALPHETVNEYMRRKATDPDRWLKGMRRLQEVYQTD